MSSLPGYPRGKGGRGELLQGREEIAGRDRVWLTPVRAASVKNTIKISVLQRDVMSGLWFQLPLSPKLDHFVPALYNYTPMGSLRRFTRHDSGFQEYASTPRVFNIPNVQMLPSQSLFYLQSDFFYLRIPKTECYVTDIKQELKEDHVKKKKNHTFQLFMPRRKHGWCPGKADTLGAVSIFFICFCFCCLWFLPSPVFRKFPKHQESLTFPLAPPFSGSTWP